MGGLSPYTALLQRARTLVDIEHALLDAAMREAAPSASGQLLDVGCGDKPYESLFAPWVTRYVGLEFQETYSVGVSGSSRPRADVVYHGGTLPFDDASFDTVLSNQVFEHVRDPRAFFAELARVLRPGGRLIVTVPFSYRVHAAPHDYHRFTRYSLAEYARQTGLTVERLTPRGGFWSVIGQKLTSQMAVRFARLTGDIQTIGGFSYEERVLRRPRYWTLPVLAPLIVGVAATAKLLDRVDFDDSDTLGYLMIASRPAR